MTGAAGATVGMRKAFGWGGTIAIVRMVCSFISIKVTAVYLGPAGLALVAQLTSFIGLFQSMLGQGLVTGTTRLAAEHETDQARQRTIFSTAMRMGASMAAVLSVILIVAGPFVSKALLTDRQFAWAIALSGVAVAAAMLKDYIHGAFSVVKEIGLNGTATILQSVTGVAIIATSSYLWGVNGGLAGTIVAAIVAATISIAVLRMRSRHLRIADFLGRFDWHECGQIGRFYPMLIVNGAFLPMTLILVRDALATADSLDAAGLWQATWRLSEVYQSIVAASVTLYFMPHLGECMSQPDVLRRRVLRTLAAAVGATATLAAGIALLRSEIVGVVLTHKFELVSAYLPVQLLGDVLKTGAWVLSMTLVALLRTRWFISVTILHALVFVGITHFAAPQHGVYAALWAYVIAVTLQFLLAVFALRDVLGRAST